MQPDTYQMLAARQDHYWWHRARRRMSIALLHHYDVAPGAHWLDLGCGAGGNLSVAQAFGPDLVIGIDLSPLAIGLARTKTARVSLVQADISFSLPLSNSSCDVATIFNVLYHEWISSEIAVLAEVARVLRPGGLVLLTEPAFPVLTRKMDDAAMTRKRYRRSELIDLCRRAKLEVLLASYFTSFGFPLLLGLKAIRLIRALWSRAQLGPEPDMLPLSPIVNETLHALAMIEATLIARSIPMPFGTTLLCLARRTNGAATVY